MYVQPNSGLRIELDQTGTIGAHTHVEVAGLLDMLHYHVRYSIIEMWFGHRFMPKTWDEVQQLQQASQSPDQDGSSPSKG